MLRVLYYGLLIPSRIPTFCSMTSKAHHHRDTLRMSTSSLSSSVDPARLAKAWTPQLVELEEYSSNSNSKSRHDDSFLSIVRATERTLPLLEDVASVPFVCRYRTDIIHPLTTRQVHFLQGLIVKHASLESLRKKLLQVVLLAKDDDGDDDATIKERILTSTSKTELEDLYAPFKPPSKGSILERIQKEHPKLVEAVDQLWTSSNSSNDKDGAIVQGLSKLGPKDALLHLLSSKIAAEPKIAAVVLEELRKHCRVQTTSDDAKYQNYNDFSGPLVYLKDHQVLAIRRGSQQKRVKMSFDMDGSKMEGCIHYHLRHGRLAPKPLLLHRHELLMTEAIHEAWTRLLRRRGTTRLWNEKCKEAQERACQVFEDNLRRALLTPPRMPPAPVLSLDPGFQAGIKCAILDPSGKVVELGTIKFLGNQQREDSIRRLGTLLSAAQHLGNAPKVLVALGNGHGSQDCRMLIQEASEVQSIPIDIQLVNEAGASVWSVTETAKDEFPNEPPAAIAAISIGRRLQNPLHELVKVPPRSLGLGMYQHDLSEKELDEKLHLTSVDAVATVGVDANSCSLEILRKVPGLTKLTEKIIKARPLKERKDLLKVAGLGPKTFENCAAFCRVLGPEPLDATLVHPESYELARWLLKKFSWSLDETPTNIPPRKDWKTDWDSEIPEASKTFGVTADRVLAVIDNLVLSMMKVDPRLNESDETVVQSVGSIEGCVLLPPDLAGTEKLASASPVRGIIGTIRNIADFGAFVDFGGHNDGLLHISKLGPLRLSNLLIGQQLGVDILSVTDGKVSLGVSGLNFEPDTRVARPSRPTSSVKGNRQAGASKRSISTKARPQKAKRRRID
jgi:uncharacterized protein